MSKISILGCGWLGIPLAQDLLKQGYIVSGSTTSVDKLQVLEQLHIDPFLISLNVASVEGAIAEFLSNSTVLIIDIPPKLRTNSSERFVSKIANLIPYIEQSTVSKVLFVSSTSVYADDNSVITDDTIPIPSTESAKQLLEVEELLFKNNSFDTTVLRFAGLIGMDRHPVRILSGRDNIENPDAPINLIHQIDCIGIIRSIIARDYWNKTINAATPFHPTRESYYTKKAESLELSVPKFNQQYQSVGKTILSTTIEKDLGYSFIITDTI